MLGRNLAVIRQRVKRPQALGQRVRRGHPLAEDDRLAAAGHDFFQIGLQPFALRAGPGGRIEIANLLQPQHQLEDVLDRGAVAHFGQPQHAFVFRQLIALALLGLRSISASRNSLGGQLGEHLVFGAAENVRAGRLAHAPRLHLARQMAGGQKLENAHQVFGAVFDRRAGEGPTAPPRNRTDRSGWCCWPDS